MMFLSRFFLVFVLLGVVTVFGAPYPAPKAPNCAAKECPSYTVLWANNELEIRDYQSAQWVSTPTLPAKSYADGANKGYLVLLNYYNGNNQRKETINRTWPILVDVSGSNYKVYFYLPSTYQKAAPPQPFSSDIIQTALPRYRHAAVRRFDGFVSETNIKEQLAALKKGLQGTPYQPAAGFKQYTVAGYNDPSETTNRVNEIFLWFN